MEKVVIIFTFLISFNVFSQGSGNGGTGGPDITAHVLRDFGKIGNRVVRGEITIGDWRSFGDVVDVNTARFGVQDRDSFLDTHSDSAIVIDDSLYVDPKKVEVIDYQTRDGAFIYDPVLFGIEEDEE